MKLLLLLAAQVFATAPPYTGISQPSAGKVTQYLSGNLCVAASSITAGTCAVNVNGAGGAVTATLFTGAVTGNVTGNLTGNVTGNVSGTSGSTTGNAATATALAANPTNCSSGNYPLGIDASGNVESCTTAGVGDVVTSASNNFGTAATNQTFGSSVTFKGYIGGSGGMVSTFTHVNAGTLTQTSFIVSQATVTLVVTGLHDVVFQVQCSATLNAASSNLAWTFFQDGQYIGFEGLSAVVGMHECGYGGAGMVTCSGVFTVPAAKISAGSHKFQFTLAEGAGNLITYPGTTYQTLSVPCDVGVYERF